MMTRRPRVTFTGKDKNIFFITLKKRVEQHFIANHKSVHANTQMVVKTAIMISAYILPYLVLVMFTPPLWPSLLLWFVMGFGVAGVGMGVMHDANHGAYSSSNTVNKILSATLNLVGGSQHNWRLQHNILHHTYTNITAMDDDIADTTVLDFSIRFSPNTPVRWYHKFQPLYIIFFYGIMTIYWVTAKDFVLLVTYTREGINPKNTRQNIRILIGLIVFKGFYFFMMLGLPVIVGMSFLDVVIGFLLMHFVTGIILTTVFQLAHAVDETQFPVPDDQGKIQNAWAIHQMETTMNFASRNTWLSWYIGGLNYQIEHHLFPSICHVHLPEISPIVKETAREFGIPYNEHSTLMAALRSHVKHMIHIGKLPDLNEGIG
jgi:linoleoyl-CoA desaturase